MAERNIADKAEFMDWRKKEKELKKERAPPLCSSQLQPLTYYPRMGGEGRVCASVQTIQIGDSESGSSRGIDEIE